MRVWRDWALLGVLLAWSVLEALFRDGLIWPPAAVVITVAVLLPLLWRRTHPLVVVVTTFGILTAFDVVRILAATEHGLLLSIAGVLVLPYSLFRWGAGREAGIGLGIILRWNGSSRTSVRTGRRTLAMKPKGGQYRTSRAPGRGRAPVHSQIGVGAKLAERP
ncbi:MAG: DUF7134 domain-containing protein [Actinomycetota bacterium]